MNGSENMSDLIRQSIAASDRTTRAVRALVRFIFIQLSTTTAAGALIYFGMANVNPGTCAAYGENCEPSYALVVIGLIVWIVGIFVSSSAGWTELAKSDPDILANRGLSNAEIQSFEAEEHERVRAAAAADEARIQAESQAALTLSEERRKRRDELFKKTWFRLSILGGILALAAGVFLVMSNTLTPNPLSGTYAGIQSASIKCHANAAITYYANGAQISIEENGDAADCVVKELSGASLASLNLLPNGESEIVNDFEFFLRGGFVTISPQNKLIDAP